MKKHMPQIIEKQMLKVLGGFDKQEKTNLISVLGSLRSILGDDQLDNKKSRSFAAFIFI